MKIINNIKEKAGFYFDRIKYAHLQGQSKIDAIKTAPKEWKEYKHLKDSSKAGVQHALKQLEEKGLERDKIFKEINSNIYNATDRAKYYNWLRWRNCSFPQQKIGIDSILGQVRNRIKLAEDGHDLSKDESPLYGASMFVLIEPRLPKNSMNFETAMVALPFINKKKEHKEPQSVFRPWYDNPSSYNKLMAKTKK